MDGSNENPVLSDAENEVEMMDNEEGAAAPEEVELVESGGNVIITPKFTMSYRDVEDTLRSFEGADTYPVEVWVSDFEESALLLGWNELQKLVFAKKSLKGLAKLFVQSERGIKTWSELKSRLLSEFSTRINSAQLHEMLRQRKMKADESVHQYYLIMKELASRGRIEDEALIQYIIDGIPDSTTNKIVLYEAKTLVELKEKMNTYSKIRSKQSNYGMKNRQTFTAKPEVKKETEVKREGGLVCYNCNERGHGIRSCPKPKRERGSCYKCGAMGHTKQNCPQRGTTAPTPAGSATNNTTAYLEDQHVTIPCYTLSISLEVGNFRAVLDTGSPISLLDINSIPNSFVIKPNNENLIFEGINGSKLCILGRLVQNIEIGKYITSVNFYVVPSNTIKCNCLLGRDFLCNPEFEVVLTDKIELRKRQNDEQLEPNGFQELLQINVADYNIKVKLDVNNKLEWSVNQRVHEIFEQYYLEPIRPCEPLTKLELELVMKANHKPFFYNPRRLSYNEKEAVKEILNDLLSRNIIRPSSSQYGSPIVLVRKKNGEYRMAVDYRELNKMMIRDHFPIPRIDEQIDGLRDKRYFTRLDLKDAFHHIKLKENSIPYTAFVTFMGQYEWIRMPFGLSSGPSFFMRFISTAFRDLLEKNKILMYLDDLLIATETVEENLQILKEVLIIMVNNKLDLRIEKCKFLLTEIDYLGYIIDHRGIRPNPANVSAITEYPIPRNFHELHSFLGLASYFRKFIKHFATITKPLYDLLKSKENFMWKDEHIHCFEVLKQILITQPVLAIYSPKLDTELHCDASSYGYGSVLLQKQTDGKFHPVSYFSKRTTQVESRYHSFELEALAIVYSLERFRVYLQGISFKIITDCNSLKQTLERKEINPRILRWSLILRNYNYTLEHRGSNYLKHSDALSRQFNILIITENSFERNLELLQDLDENIKLLKNKLSENEDKLFELNNGLVYRKSGNKLLFYVPQSMEHNVIQANHEQVGHQGINKTVEYLSRVYWFPDLRTKVKKFITNCLKCITYSTISNRVEGHLNCPDKGDVPFNCIHIDHYGPLEKTRHRQKYIFEIIDAFTKFVKFYPVVSTGTDEVIKYLKLYFQTYSKPKIIVSDRGSAFMSDRFKEFLREHSVKHVAIATATPHANGQMERINRSLTSILSKLSASTSSWDQILSEAEFSINNTINRSTGQSPAKLLFGVNQVGTVKDSLHELLKEQVNEARNLDILRSNAVANIIKTNEYNTNYYNKKHKTPTKFKLGDYVVIKNFDVTPGINKKLLPKYRGPYVIKAVLDNDRYVISDPEGNQLTQIPFEGICSPQNMKFWVNPN